ncbi:hypothetical protein ACFYQ5_13965 [Streptomyces sp. NPDC005794]|uniref:hypothetical protein n=1 Tax=Streptomyces sp. NPDC005794 TaxID=3364733 RepID=UPI0036CAF756
MKRTLALASVVLATVALASPAQAAPGNTPARACSLGTVDLKNPPLGYPVERIEELAARLGLGALPTGLGIGCDKAVRTDPYSDVHSYPHDGPVVLRAGETARTQLYCTDSVAVFGKILDTVPVETLVVIGSGCVVQANPIII